VSSQISDASAALLICSERALAEQGLTPRARIHHMSVRGDDPIYMLTAPIPATHYALQKSGLALDDIDLIEINEAFASQGLACLRQLGVADDSEHVNPHGGAIALGHPLGMSGARLAMTAAHGLHTRGGKLALATMCVGVGQGVSLALERV
jgi:3-oxoadipyl-CoA thiolase